MTDAGVLEGLRVIEIATYVAGPSGGMALAQLGAEVIRIDPIGGATDTRRLPLNDEGTSLYWASLNRGKRSVEVNLSSQAGRDVVRRLIAAPGPGAGIVLTNAVGQGWLQYDALSAERDDLIHVHILGRRDGKPAVDYTVNCEVGLPLLTGPAEFHPPVNHVLPAWDLLTGLHAALGILAAERQRARTGRGQSIRISLADVAAATMGHLAFVADVAVNGRGRLRDGNYLYGSFGADFATRDGTRVMIVALTARHWRKLVDLTGLGDTIAALEQSLGVDLTSEEERFRYREVLAALLRPWFESRTFGEVAPELDANQLLWGPYRTIEQFVYDPTSTLHDVFTELEQPGYGTFPAPRGVLDLAGLPNEPMPAPLLGQDTEAVLGDLLGLGDGDLASLRESGVIGATKVTATR